MKIKSSKKITYKKELWLDAQCEEVKSRSIEL